MKMLVTGGAGFIGSHIVDALIERGHDVTIIDNMITGQQENINPAATFIKMDIRDKGIKNVLAQHKIEIIFHQAAQLDVRKSVDDPIYDADVNILGTLNLLQAAAAAGAKKILFASTGGAIYGEQVEFPATESHPAWPASPYGVTKLACERYIHYFSEAHGIRYGLMRYANVYGPRQNAHGEAGVVAIFSDKLLDGDQPVINGDGTQSRDFVYVHDVVNANMLAMEHDQNDYFNVGTGVETDVNTVFRLLNRHSGANKEEIHMEAKAGEQMRSVLSYDKIKNTLGWTPKMKIDEGLKHTVDFFINQRTTI